MKKSSLTRKKPLRMTKKVTDSRKVGKPLSRTRKTPLAKLKKELDVVFSMYVRQRDNHTCFTCGKQLEPTKSQCGHFVVRKYLGTRFDEQNCAVQCFACNINLHGNSSVFAERLLTKYGSSIIADLNARRQTITKLTPDWYREKIAHYRALLME